MFLKVCGIKTVSEAADILDCNINYLGLNFIPYADRFVDELTAKAIAVECKRAGIKTVALFKDQKINEVKNLLSRVHIDYVQLNGAEDQAYINELQLPVMKTIAVDPEMSAEKIIEIVSKIRADYYILDRKIQGKGQMVSMALFNEVSKTIPGKLVLAGGITPDNLGSLLQHVQPAGIDISSGVRSGESVSVDKVQRCLALIDSATAAR